MITGIRDPSYLTNRDTSTVNTDQSEEWRVENFENLRGATRKVQQRYFKRVATQIVFPISVIHWMIMLNFFTEFDAFKLRNICAWCCVVQTVSLGLWQDVMVSDAAVLLLCSPPLASVSCSEYRTHFSYTHQLSENRYNQTHCLHMCTKICSIQNKSYLMFAKRILKIFTLNNLETLAFLS